MVAPKITLSNGSEMPIIGLGTWASKPNEVTEAVKNAIDLGYRHFDCAHVYGNEAEVGTGIREKIADGTIKREDVFVTSKLWCTFHSKESVVPACRRSVEKFGLDYLDLYLIHAPYGFEEDEKEIFPKASNGKIMYSDVDYIETWKGMEDCVELGITKSIGLSNFNSEQITRVLAIAKIKPVINQVECNPNLNQKQLSKFCKDRDIVVTAYCPLGRPGFVDTAPGTPIQSLNDEKIKDISLKYGKTPAQVVLRYLVQIEAYPLPKSVNKARLKENISIFDFELSKKEMDYIDTLDKNYRICPFYEVKDHPFYPFNIDY